MKCEKYVRKVDKNQGEKEEKIMILVEGESRDIIMRE